MTLEIRKNCIESVNVNHICFLIVDELAIIRNFIQELIEEEDNAEAEVDRIPNFIHELVENEEREAQRRLQFQQLQLQRRVLRDTSNPFELDAEYFRKYYRLNIYPNVILLLLYVIKCTYFYYRFTPEVALILVNLIEDTIVREHVVAIPAHVQVLIVLRFLAEGSYQKGFGQDFNHPVSQSTASRCVHAVVNAINTLTDRFIAFPSTQEERHRVQAKLV